MGAITNYQAYLKTEPNNAGVRSNLGAAYVRLGRLADGVTQDPRRWPSTRATRCSASTWRWRSTRAASSPGGDGAAGVSWPSRAINPAGAAAARRLLSEAGTVPGCCSRTCPAVGGLVSRRSRLRATSSAPPSSRPTAWIRGSGVIDTIFKDGESAEGHLLMGTVHMNAGDSPAALAELRKAVELNPQLPVANGMLGRALLRNGEHEAALARLPPRARDQSGRVRHQPAGRRAEEAGAAVRRCEDLHRARAADAPRRRRRPLRPVGCVRLARQERGSAAAARGRRRGRAEVFGGLRACSRLVYYRLQRKADGDRHARARARN